MCTRLSSRMQKRICLAGNYTSCPQASRSNSYVGTHARRLDYLPTFKERSSESKHVAGSRLSSYQRSVHTPLISRPGRGERLRLRPTAGASSASELSDKVMEQHKGGSERQDDKGSVPVKAKPGRRSGCAAWNKGLTTPQSTRSKISKAMQNRWQNPAYVKSVQHALKGRTAWNKGRPFSVATRKRMSDARSGVVVSEDTRKRMSVAQTGRVVSAETRAKMRQIHVGKSLPAEQRAKIAESMRRRWAKRRESERLAAEEQCTTSPQTSSTTEQVSPPVTEIEGPDDARCKATAAARATDVVTAGEKTRKVSASTILEAPVGRGLIKSAEDGVEAGRGRQTEPTREEVKRPRRDNDLALDINGRRLGANGRILGRPRKSDPPGISQAQARRFRKDMQRFREVSAELKTWSDFFAARHSRRPTRADVAATRIAWLEEHFEEYFALRARLVEEAPNLRQP